MILAFYPGALPGASQQHAVSSRLSKGKAAFQQVNIQVIELGRVELELPHYLPQADSSGDVGEYQHDKLLPGG